MPRKSVMKRLEEAKATLALWEGAGQGGDRSAQFMRDMIVRLERHRGLSKGQRSYLDSLIEQGAPKTHNEERVAEINKARETAGMEAMSGPLSDFAYKLSKGWKLSEKQEAFLGSLLDQAKKLQENGLPVLTDAEKRLVEHLLVYAAGRGDWYWQHRQGGYNAFQNALRFYETHGTLDERSFSRLKNTFKGATKHLTEPRFPEGSLAIWRNKPAIVVSPPYALRGYKDICIDALVEGEPVVVAVEQLRKRMSK